MSDSPSRPPQTPLAGIRFDATSTTPAVDAATVIAIRPRPSGDGPPLEIFTVVRNPKSGFLGGALVFPGGKVDPSDRATTLERGLLPRWDALGGGPELATCAVRETLEEAGLLDAPSDRDAIRAARAALLGGASFADVVAPLQPTARGLRPFARWITPRAESRRFDTRFFLFEAPLHAVADHDGHETVAGAWLSAREAIEKFHAGEVMLAPPTLRVFELLEPVASLEEARALADAQSLAPICPEFIAGDPPMLVLPGDPLHSEGDVRCALGTRFVLRDGRFQSERA